MSIKTEDQPQPVERQILSIELVKSKLQIALTKAEQSIQGLHTAESQLTYNEDNLTEIKEFIEKCKKAEKVIEDQRVKMKEPSLQEGRNIDAGAKLLAEELAAVKKKAHDRYTKMCIEIEDKKKKAEQEKERVAGIKAAMDGFILDYSVKIADAKTDRELVDIERLINLETANAKKYGEFLDEFKGRCKAIRELLAGQKLKVKEMAELAKQEQEAAEKGDDQAVLDIRDKMEGVAAQIDEHKVKVQEEAISQTISSPTPQAEVILPSVSTKRRTWKYEVKDIQKLFKKAPHLVDLIANDVKIKDILKNKVAEGETKGKEEIQYLDGAIRFYVEKTY